jgi:cell fate regulator YaaT (PSP1 superfamily)
MLRIVPVKFHHAGRQYDFNAQGLELQPGSRVVVETERGRALAIVVTAPREIPVEQAPEGLKSVLRIATDDDIAQAAANAAREKNAVRYCKERIQSRNLEMKLVRAEYAFDGSKIVFYFTAEGRIDFRDLVKDLAHHFHTALCCCSFLTEFYPVSVKMAKEQGLALNPTKISGQCGRLLCCLGYEFEAYCELRKGMPKCGKKVCWDNREWEVTAQNALGRQLTLRQADGTTRVVAMDEYESGQAREPVPPAVPPTAPPRRQAEAPAQNSRPAPPRERPAPPPPAASPSPAAMEPEPSAEEAAKDGSRRKRRRRRRSGRPAAPAEQGE